MTNNILLKTATEFIRRDSRYVRLAELVARAWPAVCTDIVARFAGHLRERIAVRLKEGFPQLGNLHCDHSVTGNDKEKWVYVRVYRHGGAWDVGGHRVSVMLQAQRPGAAAWIIGVNTGNQLPKIRDALSTSLSNGLVRALDSDHWPWYEDVDERWRTWHQVVPELAQELENDGEATRYFVDRFAEICEVAVPIIDRTIHDFASE